MSQSFRAVKETWGESTSEFIGRERLTDLLEHVAECANTTTNVQPYANLMAVWIEDGKRFLDYVCGDEINAQDILTALEWSQEYLDGTRMLLGNMRTLAPKWRKESIGRDGELNFYLD